MVSGLRKPGAAIKEELTAEDVDLLHMAIGVCGEAGELIDAVKKSVVYRKPLDLANMKEELGDLEFYMEGIRQITGISRDDALTANLAKLQKRYPGYNYSNARAVERADKEPGG